MLGIFLHHSPSSCLRQGLSLTWSSLFQQPGWLEIPRDALVSAFHHWDCRHMLPGLAFMWGAGVLDSGPHDCVPGTSLTEPPS